MIIFRNLRWKNLLSTGNFFTELNLDGNNTTLIVGSNGSGKSTMLDALCFVLFGKPFRSINKPLLVNSINGKDCVVEVEFDSHNKSYRIVRGIKPNLFEIYCNGKMVNQDANARDYQKYLEQNILKLNYRSFTQVVILGSSTFIPFMQLKARHRREVVEEILDIQIFSTMNMILKQKLKTVAEDIRDIEYQYNLEIEKISLQENLIADLKDNKDKITYIAASRNRAKRTFQKPMKCTSAKRKKMEREEERVAISAEINANSSVGKLTKTYDTTKAKIVAKHKLKSNSITPC